MGQPIQVLVIEDRAADAELMVRQLQADGFDPDWRRVDSERAIEANLSPTLDVILADYTLPQLNALRILEILKASEVHVPLIIVSGTVGDEKAAECLKLGASDYILKDRMARLGAAVRSAIDERLAKAAKREAEAALRRSEERTRSILSTVEDLVFSLSLPDLRVQYVNPAAEKVFKRPVADFVADPTLWLECVHPEDRARMTHDQQEAIRWGTAESDFRIVWPDGTVRQVRSRVWAAYGDDGHPVRLEGIVSDITERLAAEEQQRELAHLAELNAFKSQFLNMVAHDLNNVVTPMRINLHGLNAAAGRGELAAHAPALAMINRATDRLLGFLGDLLDAARLQSGKLSIQAAPVDLVALVAGAIDDVRGQAQEVGLALRFEGPRELTAAVDARRIGQVLANLLSNAVKFTPSGGQVVVSLQRMASEARLRVTDSGVGLRQADIGRLFLPFSRIGSAAQGQHTGTGLGLFISKGIVEGHGGRIWAESAGPGKGTAFFVALPLAGPPPATTQPQSGIPASEAGRSEADPGAAAGRGAQARQA